MENIKKEFSKFVIEQNIIKFGEFVLKSGRVSPYFFNFGSFNDASKLSSLGEFYASTIIEQHIEYDVIFGPAYKGIPISLTTSLALYNTFGVNARFSFNRKEAKEYGEGGNVIGCSIGGKRVLAVDDVLTSGRTIKETKQLIEREGGVLTSFLVALDREEKGTDSDLSALEEAAQAYNIQIYAVSGIKDIVTYMETCNTREMQIQLSNIRTYFQKFGKSYLAQE